MTHRDPVRALRSTESLLLTMNWARSDVYEAKGLSDVTSAPELAARRLDQPIDWMQRGVVLREQLCNVLYRDLVADPLKTLEYIYGYFAVPFTSQARQAIAKYLREHPRDARPWHRYAADSDETVARARRAFKRYQDFFQVPDE